MSVMLAIIPPLKHVGFPARLNAKAGYTLIEFWTYQIQTERGHENGRLDEKNIIEKVRNALEKNSDFSARLALVFG